MELMLTGAMILWGILASFHPTAAFVLLGIAFIVAGFLSEM